MAKFTHIKTREQFIERANERHENKYTYEKVVFHPRPLGMSFNGKQTRKLAEYNGNQKVIITCPLHGDFEQTARKHIEKEPSGCHICGKNKTSYNLRKNKNAVKTDKLFVRSKVAKKKISKPKKQINTIQKTEEFIKKAKKAHGDKYDYSKSVYITADHKVCIICPKHGEFFQSPYSHCGSTGRKGSNCPECAKEAGAKKITKTTQQFIKKAKEKHGDRFDYSKTVYINAKTKVCIICPEHGEFWTLARAHLRHKHSCSKCGGSAKKTQKQFIEHAKRIHGDKYDYSKVVYVSAKIKVCIVCPEHGDFWQTPPKHANGGRNCPECAKESGAKKIRKTQEQFILDCKKIHGDKYNYDKAIYKKDKLPVIITCPEHGDFEQVVNYHLQGQGCPYCGNKSIAEKTAREVLEGLLKTALPTTRQLDCLKSPQTGYRLELDGYCEKNKIAFEFQGRQHYEPIPFYGGEEGLRVRQKRDAIKRSACIANGICLIEIDGRKIPSSVRTTKERLKPYILEQLLDQPEWKKKRLMPLLENNHSLQ